MSTMNNPTAHQQQAYDDFFSENPSDGGSIDVHPDFSGASFAPIGPPMAVPNSNINRPKTGNIYGAAQNPSGPLPWWKRIFWLFAIETYQPYFNVDTDDVQHRLVGSVKYLNVDDGFWTKVLVASSKTSDQANPDLELPHPGQQRQQLQRPQIQAGKKGPDAYGPFWLATTLIFLLAVTSNISNYLHHYRGEQYQEDFQYDISILAHAVWVMYGFTFAVPLALAVVLRVLLADAAPPVSSKLPTFAELMCLYGYSLVPFVPGFIFSGLVPVNFIQWLVILASTSTSLLFVLRNLAGRILGTSLTQQLSSQPQRATWHEDDLEGDFEFAGAGDAAETVADRNAQVVHSERSKGTSILASVIGIHVLFGLVLKLGFYHPYDTDDLPTR